MGLLLIYLVFYRTQLFGSRVEMVSSFHKGPNWQMLQALQTMEHKDKQHINKWACMHPSRTSCVKQATSCGLLTPTQNVLPFKQMS